MEQITKYFNPLFDYLDSGKLFRRPLEFLYILLGVGTCVLGIKEIVGNFEGFEYMPSMMKVYNILMVVVLLALCVYSLVFWLHRAGGVSKEKLDGTRFLAIPILANLLRSFGEWLGTVLAIFGVCSGVLTILLLTADGGKDAFFGGLILLVGLPILGYLLLVLFRFIGEKALALATIANNTTDILNKLNEK